MPFYKPACVKMFLLTLGLLALQAGCMTTKPIEGSISFGLKDNKPISWALLNAGQSDSIGLVRVQVTDGAKPMTSDYIYRKTSDPSRDDAVAVIATVEIPDKESALLLVRQYRPSHDKFVAEFPTALIGHHTGEEQTQAALRELREQTGYGNDVPGVTVFAKSTHSGLAEDPGLSNCRVTVVQASIKLEHENVNVMPNSQGSGKLKAHLVPLSKLQEYLLEYSKLPRNTVSANVMQFAAGLALSKASQV